MQYDRRNDPKDPPDEPMGCVTLIPVHQRLMTHINVNALDDVHNE